MTTTRIPKKVAVLVDSHRRLFYDVYPDMVGIALLQHRKDRNDGPTLNPGAAEGPTIAKKLKQTVRRTRRRKKTARGSEKKRKRRRCRERSCTWQIRRLHDLRKAIVRQAHNAFANHLVRYYNLTVMPEFMTGQMVRKRRKLLKLPPLRDTTDVNTAPRTGKFTLHKTTRKAIGWISHYAFRRRLFAKALADPNEVKDVVCTTEEYTTKQCPFCHFIHHKIGSNKVFKCQNPECGFEGRRDNSGAFSVGLRSLVKGEVIAVL
jgi:transposase